jgi:hypothetical protein
MNEFLPAPLWTLPDTLAIARPMVRRSSAVEQLTVNQLVVGSIPTAGAKIPPQEQFIEHPQGPFYVSFALVTQLSPVFAYCY